MWATAPVSWPISKGLDALLGKEQPVFGKRQISALVDLHRWAMAVNWSQLAGCSNTQQVARYSRDGYCIYGPGSK